MTGFATKHTEVTVPEAGTYLLIPKDALPKTPSPPPPSSTKGISDFLEFSDNIDLLKYIRIFRECKEQTLEVAAKGLKMDAQYLQKIESGKQKLTKKTEARMVKFWGEKFEAGLNFIKSKTNS